MEISAQELRIGNYINGSIGDDSELVLCYVTGYDPRDEFIFVSNDNNIHYAEFVDFQPIPLTKEWLLKFGFEKKVEGAYIYKGSEECYYGVLFGEKIYFTIFEDYTFIDRYEVRSIRYIHQLQNLYFALTDEELRI